MSIRRLRNLIQQLPADVRIGKNGISEGLINEIKRRLKTQGYVKVKILRNAPEIEFMNRKDIAKIVAEKCGGKLIDVRGKTFVLISPTIRLSNILRELEDKIIKV